MLAGAWRQTDARLAGPNLSAEICCSQKKSPLHRKKSDEAASEYPVHLNEAH
jgi:hypothetical protein